MKLEKISKYEALRLVTPVIDNEVCHETRRAFFENMCNYPEVNYHFKSARHIKKLMKNRCPRAKVTSDFYCRIKSVIALQKDNKSFKN